MRPDICPVHRSIIADGQPCLFSDCAYGPESLLGRPLFTIVDELDEAKKKRNALNLKLSAILRRVFPKTEDDNGETTQIRAGLVSIEFDIIQLGREFNGTFPEDWRQT